MDTPATDAPTDLELNALRARAEKAWLERLLDGAKRDERHPDPKAAVDALHVVAALRR